MVLTKPRLRILTIVPAFNEEATLPSLVADLREKAPFADIIVINDCSTDRTLEICGQLHVPTITTIYNLGIGGAMQTGYRYAHQKGYEIAVQVDGDGQHPPEQIMELITPLDKGEADLVIGSRFIQQNSYKATLPRLVGISLFSFVTSCITRQKITDVTSGFRAANRKTIDFFVRNYPDDFPDAETLILLAFSGLKIKEIPIIMRPRTTGISSFNFTKSLLYICKTSLSIMAALLSYNGKEKKTK